MFRLCDEGNPQVHERSRREFVKAATMTAIAAAGLNLSATRPARAAATSAGHRVLVYGDSNTWGSSARVQGRPVTRLPDHERWAGVLAQALKAIDVTVIVDGLTGRTTDLDRTAGIGAVVTGSDFNGARSLRVALAREMPLDLVIIMLGTNDLAAAYNRSPAEIASAVMSLADIVRTSAGGAATSYGAPKVLVVVPPALGNLDRSLLKEAFAGGGEKSIALRSEFLKAANTKQIPVFDASSVTATDGDDGVHLTAQNHRAIGVAIAPVVEKLLK